MFDFLEEHIIFYFKKSLVSYIETGVVKCVHIYNVSNLAF
jgi:hypothetical protein